MSSTNEVIDLTSSSSPAQQPKTSSSLIKRLREKGEQLKEEEESRKKNSGNSCLQKISSMFDCAICYETMACTTTLSPCGCNYCFVCVEEWYRKNPNGGCPCCKQSFKLHESIENKRIDAAIREIYANIMSIQEIAKWEERVHAGKERRQAMVVNAQHQLKRMLSKEYRAKAHYLLGLRTRCIQFIHGNVEGRPPLGSAEWERQVHEARVIKAKVVREEIALREKLESAEVLEEIFPNGFQGGPIPGDNIAALRNGWNEFVSLF